MSDPVFPVKNAQYSAGIADISEVPPLGMITLRGDFATRGLRKAVKQASSCEIPGVREIALSGDKGVAWMSPDELLLILPHEAASEAATSLSKALADKHFMAVEVSDARAVITLEGEGLREVLAKLSPQDMHPDAFPPGRVRRTHLGQVAAAFWLTDESHAVVICFRSVADYAFALLAQSAKDGPVGVF